MPEWNTIGFVSGSGNSNSVKEYSFKDENSVSGNVSYRLKQIDNDGTFAYSKEIEVDNLQPSAFDLSQNYPNPFNPSTVISYELPVMSNVLLKVFDMIGNEVATLVNEEKSAGYHTVKFDAAGLASGIYLYKLTIGNYLATKKMILLR